MTKPTKQYRTASWSTSADRSWVIVAVSKSLVQASERFVPELWTRAFWPDPARTSIEAELYVMFNPLRHLVQQRVFVSPQEVIVDKLIVDKTYTVDVRAVKLGYVGMKKSVSFETQVPPWLNCQGKTSTAPEASDGVSDSPS